MTKKKWLIAFILISCVLITIHCIRIWNGHYDIASGNISYSYNCSWVDWQHARTGGINKFVAEFNQKFDQAALNQSFKISYGQQGGLTIKNHSIYTYGISKEYEILKFSEDEIIKKKLMFQIFKDVSYLFENQQKEVFWGVLKLSAFRDGDLMGNLIGFYIACGEMTQEEASQLCGELSISISLQLKKEGKFQSNDSFIPKYRMIIDGNTPIFPMPLTKYNDIAEINNYITLLETTTTKTFFNKSFSK